MTPAATAMTALTKRRDKRGRKHDIKLLRHYERAIAWAAEPEERF